MNNVPELLSPTSVNSEIQVSGLTCFEESRWREAILYYLFGVWSGRQNVMYRPKISFGSITLKLDLDACEYYAEGLAEVPQEPPSGPADLVVDSGRQADVEVALIRFVKDNRIRQFHIGLPSIPRTGAHIVLWKKERRGEYGYAGVNLPLMWVSGRPLWTREDVEEWLRAR